MCGIAGIYHQNLSPINPMILKRMTDILQHRGPDDSGYFLFNLKTNDAQTSLAEPTHANEFHIGLGHRRLSILDLSSHGHQPMHNEDKTIWITYNGEIYNYIELRAELVRAGHQFYSRTDSEVIIHAYEQWGIDCLNKFNGMWAFAILDTRQKKLFCARDRFGIKPFYFYYDKGAFYFASEIKALLQIHNLPIEYNHAKILRYLIWGLIDEDEQTMIQSIKRLKPGHYLILDKQKLSEACYYDLKSKLTLREIQTEKIEQTFRELFFDSVNLRLRSDVPVGTCLSGGLDSSSILSVMRQLSPNATTLHTFSSIFKGEAIDESRYIELMVKHVQAKAFFTSPEPQGLLKDLNQLIWYQDEPFWSTTTYNHFCVMRLARQNGVTVLLDGQGGDELLAGYHHYAFEYILHLLQHGKIKRLAKQIDHLSKFTSQSKIRLLLGALALTLSPQLRFQLQQRFGYIEKRVIQPHYLHQAGDIQKTYDPVSNDRILNRNYYDFHYSIPHLLRLEDRNSMAFSLESRVPFLDYRLVELLFSVPAEQKYAQGISKLILRNSMRGIVPDQILNRKDKIGFATPEPKWMRTTLAGVLNDEFHSASFRNRGIYNVELLLKYFTEFIKGRRINSYVIWRWFNLEKWFQLVEKGFSA